MRVPSRSPWPDTSGVEHRPNEYLLNYARANPDRYYREGGKWMWLDGGGVAQIVCPRCCDGGGGTLRLIRIEGSDDVFYTCDECEALWHVEQFDWDNYTVGLRDLGTTLRERGLGETNYDAVLDV